MSKTRLSTENIVYKKRSVKLKKKKKIAARPIHAPLKIDPENKIKFQNLTAIF